jgi:hypothetical protein
VSTRSRTQPGWRCWIERIAASTKSRARDPLFPDVNGPHELEIGPRRIDLTRGPAASAGSAALAGTVHRRYMHRAEICEAQVPIHVTRCTGDALELVLADPTPPRAVSASRHAPAPT